MTAVYAGLLTGLSIIVAVGAQNAYVLRQGLLRSHVGAVVAFCIVSDLILISSGVLGISVAVDRAGWVLDVVRWAGVAFLVGYALFSFRRARHAERLAAGTNGEMSRAGALARAAALTWLNPHLYLDIAIYGVLANSHGSDGRWWFAAGLSTSSIIWFVALGYGARLLAPLLAKPRAWQILDTAIGVVMLVIAATLAFGG